MGIIDRLSTLIRSNINDLISRAENPQKVLEQLIVDMRNQLAKAKQQVAAAIADEKRLSAQAEQEKKLSEEWEKRAVLAVQEGRDDLAKQALLRYNEHVQGAVQLQETWVKHREETERLKASLRQLNDKIEEAKRKKNILLARQKGAEAPPTNGLASTTFVALFVAALVVLFILKVIDVLLLVLLAILLAVYLSAVTDWLERRFGMRRWLGLTLTVAATIAGVASVAALLAPPVVEQTRALIGGLPQTLTNIQSVLARWASQYPVLDQTELANPSSGFVSGLVTDAVGFLSGSSFGYVRGGGMLFIEGSSV